LAWRPHHGGAGIDIHRRIRPLRVSGALSDVGPEPGMRCRFSNRYSTLNFCRACRAQMFSYGWPRRHRVVYALGRPAPGLFRKPVSRPMSPPLVISGVAEWPVQASVGGVHSGRLSRRSTSRKRGSCRKASKNGSGAMIQFCMDPSVAHRSS